MLRQAEDAWGSLLDFLQSQKESVDHGIARNQNLPGKNTLFQEVLARILRRRKMQSRKPRGQRAIGFFRPGRLISGGRSSGRIAGPSAKTTARSITFSSSRMFPGQSYSDNNSMAASH